MWQYSTMGVCFAGLVALIFAAFWIPMRRGLAALENGER
jgi:hypothetical protein